MTKFYGLIGFAKQVEEIPGSWRNKFVERRYMGDIFKYNRRLENGQYINDDVTINNSFSIIADSYAYENLSDMRYLVWMGESWRITSFESNPPRLILTVGGVYNKQEEDVELGWTEETGTPEDFGVDSGFA